MRAVGGSDDPLLEFATQCEGEAKYNHTCILDFKKSNFFKFRELLAKIPWIEALKERGVQDGWEFFQTDTATDKLSHFEPISTLYMQRHN